MLFKQKGDLQWLEFELLSGIPGLVHGVFLRSGGVSLPPFGTLNVTERFGDTIENVKENHRRISQALNLHPIVYGNQVHGSEVVLVKGLGDQVPCCDGLITEQPGTPLMVMHGDCQAAIFYDPLHKALAVVHAGWRGLVQNIYKAALQKMKENFGTVPENLLVGIGPSLGPNHSEFIHYKKEFPPSFWAFKDETDHFNLWEIAKDQLNQCGILPHHMQIAEICTYSNQEHYFSYRRDKITGRNATIAGLL
jgi:hypothetical protein